MVCANAAAPAAPIPTTASITHRTADLLAGARPSYTGSALDSEIVRFMDGRQERAIHADEDDEANDLGQRQVLEVRRVLEPAR